MSFYPGVDNGYLYSFRVCILKMSRIMKKFADLPTDVLKIIYLDAVRLRNKDLMKKTASRKKIVYARTTEDIMGGGIGIPLDDVIAKFHKAVGTLLNTSEYTVDECTTEYNIGGRMITVGRPYKQRTYRIDSGVFYTEVRHMRGCTQVSFHDKTVRGVELVFHHHNGRVFQCVAGRCPDAPMNFRHQIIARIVDFVPSWGFLKMPKTRKGLWDWNDNNVLKHYKTNWLHQYVREGGPIFLSIR